jgi:acyl-CoA thioester hydrolase
MESEKIPFIYDGLLQVRFSDLDAYGHLSATHYVDMVGTSRLLILEERFGVSMRQLYENSVAFFLKRTEVNYVKPVKGLVAIRQLSHVQKCEGSEIEVSFEIMSKNSEVKHASGLLTYVLVDLRTSKPIPVPEMLTRAFFEV